MRYEIWAVIDSWRYECVDECGRRFRVECMGRKISLQAMIERAASCFSESLPDSAI